MALITDLPAASSLSATDLLIKDTGSATQKIAISDAYATASQPGLVSNTLQDFGGYKFFAQTSANAASIGFKFTDKSNAVYGQILQSYGSGSPNMQFRQMSVDSSGNALTYYDSYRLPAATANKSSNSTYDILTTKNVISVSANSSKVITLVNGTRGVMFAVAPAGQLRGAYIIASSSTGTGTSPTAILAASGLTITSATGQFTVANTQTTTAYLQFLIFAGGVS